MGKIRNEKLNKSVFGGHETVRVAAVQAPQIVFNKEKSIEVACKRIKEAGANGAKLVAFSETYIPVFPAYYKAGYASQIDEWAEWNVALQNNSVAIPSEDTEIIGKACREAGVYCVMGVNEIDDTDGARTLYNCQILFGPDGSILGRH
jgi:amidase/nitrilase